MIWNLGSINADFTYLVPHLPTAGETLASLSMAKGLGGKGANMSVAAARAGSRVAHIGAVGDDGQWARERMIEYGVDTRHVHAVNRPTAHAIISVDQRGENSIILYSGANLEISKNMIGVAMSEANTNDILVLQNETNNQAYCAKLGSKMGLTVAYAAAPFDVDAVRAVIDHANVLFLNAVEAQQLEEAIGLTPDKLPVQDVIVTLGGDGARWFDNRAGTQQKFDAISVDPVDTTGAGDTFTGFVLAGLDQGMPMPQAIGLATRAAAIMVTRHGTADVIPDLAEVRAFNPI